MYISQPVVIKYISNAVWNNFEIIVEIVNMSLNMVAL